MYTGQTFQEYIKYYLIFQSLFIGYQYDARETFIEETFLYTDFCFISSSFYEFKCYYIT